MIRRVGDYSTLPNDSLEKIAKVIKEKDNKKLYRVCNSNEDISIAIKEIKLQGYKSEIEKLGEAYNVYSVLPETLDISKAEESGQFKKLAWGRYSFQKANSINGFQPLNYDDGTIWRTITGEDGKQYLVKEVDDNEEDNVIRSKTANLKKKASDGSFIDDENYTSIMQILYHNSQTASNDLLKDLIAGGLKNEIYSIIAKKMDDLIIEKFQQQNIADPEHIQQAIELVRTNIDDNTIVDENTLEGVIYNFVQELLFNDKSGI